MILRYTINGHLMVPDGTTISDTGHEFVLPSGKVLKIWEAIEDHAEGEDLNQTQLNALEVFTDLDFHREMELLP